MDKHHYGSSKAAVYLADLLQDKPLLRRKIDRLMQSYNERVADILYSNIPGRTKIWCIAESMHAATDAFAKFESPINTVTQNIVKGTYKEALRTIALRGEETKRGQKYSVFFKHIPTYKDKINGVSKPT
jgi:hypothetical protein